MHATFDLPQTSAALPRVAAAVLFAATITFALFVMMQKLIANDTPSVIQPAPVTVINLNAEFKDNPVIEKNRPKPMPEPTPRPEPTRIVEPKPDNTSQFAQYTPDIRYQGPTNTFQTQMTLDDSQAMPVVRMEPKYPVDAARAGIEGWVKMLFSIDAMGQVQDIEVIDAQPKRIFDREAKKALAKWKYKPQLVAGKPQAQQGLMVVLDFKLNQ